MAATRDEFDEESFQAWYGRWAPMQPAGVARLLSGSGVRWWIAGGRAARVGASPRRHEDTDVAFLLADLPALRDHLSQWHLWEVGGGTLRPLLPEDQLAAEETQLWMRRDAQHPWELDLLVDRSEDEWVYKRDDRVRLPWDRALHTVDDITYLRPEVALLHKARNDRPKDRADLAAASLDPTARAWLVDNLHQLGHDAWARQAAHR
ncbi:MAG: hypothetical protein H0V92_06545 [Pseudonocardiales bacterium]|nr:hypothetical protein [Pseudonocardiales bacterium]